MIDRQNAIQVIDLVAQQPRKRAASLYPFHFPGIVPNGMRTSTDRSSRTSRPGNEKQSSHNWNFSSLRH